MKNLIFNPDKLYRTQKGEDKDEFEDMLLDDNNVYEIIEIIKNSYSSREELAEQVMENKKFEEDILFSIEKNLEEYERRIVDMEHIHFTKKDASRTLFLLNNRIGLCQVGLKRKQSIKREKRYYEAIEEAKNLIEQLNAGKEYLPESKLETPEPERNFADYLHYDDKAKLIEKIRNSDRDKPRKIYIILKALFDNGILILTVKDKRGLYKAYFNEFSYPLGLDTLERGMNSYSLEKKDTTNAQIISNMYEYLIS